ncbi:(2Fe-2S)-binding protein [Clostridium bornimense]|uniref:(2Fe-2S)-binding protein n=1 Tax=Clostridium bornimense TaxID=1216932 RepID=UPI001C0F9617|nr:(2Fe-2S)-binding protein [Clostridium bornimense]MBU5314898.1 (2Fe-2S)-binding protein [Clostridium bornimense]
MNLSMDNYIKVRMAQKNGARTIEELKALSDIVISTEEEKKEIQAILKQACKCNNISVDAVVELVNQGIDTIEGIKEATSAGTVCGRCEGVLANIIENKR